MKKKMYLLPILSGLLIGLSWPTYGFSALIFIAFVPLLVFEYHIRNTTLKYKSLIFFVNVFISILIWYTFCVSWIGYSTILGMLFAFVFHGGIVSFLFLIYHKLTATSKQVFSLLFLIVLWISFEKIDLEWEFSLPWLNLGNVFSENISWIQWYEYTGIFGGTLWVWILNVSFFLAIKNYIEHKDKYQLKKKVLLSLTFISLPIAVSLIILTKKIEADRVAEVVVLQPNIDPYTEKYQHSNLEFSKKIIALYKEIVTENTELIVSPETTLPDEIQIKNLEYDLSLKAIKKSLRSKNNKTNVLLGATLMDIEKTHIQPNIYSLRLRKDRWLNIYNAAVFFNQDQSFSTYFKSKPLVGIESIPYRGILNPILGDLLFDFGGTVAPITPQQESTVFKSSETDMVVAPIICYESIYGSFIRNYIKKDANLLAIITNDGWWKNSNGHKQHLSYARLRAIEMRRSIVRSANTGISAIISPKGIIHKKLEYDTKGTISAKIGLYSQQTFYAKHGDIIARVSILIFGLMLLSLISKTLRKKKNILSSR